MENKHKWGETYYATHQCESVFIRGSMGFPFFAVGLLYLVTRLYGLTSLPIFSDESIYINLAQKVADNPWRPLLFQMEGKQPLFFWLNALSLNVFSDPLVAGRMVSILAGFLSLIGIYLIGRSLFSEPHGLIAAILYVFCPYTLFFDRLALVDSLLTASGVWMVYVALWIVRETGARCFVILGLLMAMAFYIKSTALLLIPVPVFMLLLFNCHQRTGFWKHLALSGLTAVALVAPIYLFGENIGYFERTELLHIPNRLALTPDELLSFPWLIWQRNITITVEFFANYLTWPLVVLAVYGAFSRNKKNIALVLWAAFPVLAIDAVANGFYSRYFLISVPPMLLLAAIALLQLTEFMAARFRQGTFFRPVIPGIFMFIILSDCFFLRGNWFGTRRPHRCITLTGFCMWRA